MLGGDKGLMMRQILELQICREIKGLCNIRQMDKLIKTWELRLFSQALK